MVPISKTSFSYFVATDFSDIFSNFFGSIFMPPTSEEVEGAYWFGSVRAVQRVSECSQSVSL